MKASPLKVSPDNTNPFDEFFFKTHGDTGKATWEEKEEEEEVMNDTDD